MEFNLGRWRDKRPLIHLLFYKPESPSAPTGISTRTLFGWRMWTRGGHGVPVCSISSRSSLNVFSFISAVLVSQTSFVLSHFSSRHHLASHFSHFLLSPPPPPPDICIKSPDFSAHSLTVNRKWLTWISILLYEAELLSSLQLCCWKPSCW